MNKLILGRYFPGDSLVHHLDPRAKLIAVIYFIFILFIANNWQTYLLLWIFTMISMRLTNVQFRTFLKGVRPLIWLILFTVSLQILFTAGGDIYVDWGPFTISHFGIINGFYIFFRFVMIIFISTVVTFTTKPIELSDGIHFLLKPFATLKIPVGEFAFMLSIALRFIPTLLDETQKVIDAQRARGTRFGEGSLSRQMKTLIPIFLPVFMSSLNRAGELANVIEARGYRAEANRSSFRKLRWKAVDTASLCLMLLLTAGLLFLRTT